jgi:hypothetical protein
MVTEQEIKAAGADKAPRITPDDIEANIASEHYFTALDGVIGAEGTITTNPDGSVHRRIALNEGDLNPLRLLTFCVLVLRNGFTVTGESACASPENFNAEIGRKVARENAVREIWPLMGYALRSKLAFKPEVSGEDFPLGKACDLSGDQPCEACQ